jgi:hypothetical protein
MTKEVREIVDEVWNRLEWYGPVGRVRLVSLITVESIADRIEAACKVIPVLPTEEKKGIAVEGGSRRWMNPEQDKIFNELFPGRFGYARPFTQIDLVGICWRFHDASFPAVASRPRMTDEDVQMLAKRRFPVFRENDEQMRISHNVYRIGIQEARDFYEGRGE